MSETTFTPGPWRWECNPKARSVELCSRGNMGDIVMAFFRWGMSSATPVFSHDGRLRNAVEFSTHASGREHHASWHRLIDHPDAHLIAAAPDLYAAAEALLEKLSLDDDEGLMEYAEPVIALRSALAKARGEVGQ